MPDCCMLSPCTPEISPTGGRRQHPGGAGQRHGGKVLVSSMTSKVPMTVSAIATRIVACPPCRHTSCSFLRHCRHVLYMSTHATMANVLQQITWTLFVASTYTYEVNEASFNVGTRSFLRIGTDVSVARCAR
ncbi:uncharacterized protein LOC112455410, partial [Temnothorax curvispinosus]|uniref:Uncharacterized protein LOC112455410 n=1 Tax=Temnothorax curvispinosus TaxID=300111 RepID=A0A6J1PUR9_9HYME